MEYQKTIILLDSAPNEPTKFKTKNWVEINDESRRTHNEVNQIRFKTSMLRSSLCDYSNAYILVKGTITVENIGTQYQPNNSASKKIILNAPFTKCIRKINNAQVDDAHDIDVVIVTYNLIEYSDNYSKISGIWSKYCIDKPGLSYADQIVDFTVANSITE